MTNSFLIKRLNPEAKLPTRAHEGDAGLDLYSTIDATLNPNEPVKIATGVAMGIPYGYVGMVCDRSSMGSKGISTLGGIIDSGYRGEVHVILINLKSTPISIHRGDKIAQLLVMPVNLSNPVEVSDLNDTSRGSGGFGSSGR